MVPTFTSLPFDKGGAQLCPCGIATATPQAFTMASESSDINQTPSSRGDLIAVAIRTAAQPKSVRLELVILLRGVKRRFTLVTPSHLASRTQTI